MLLTDSYAITPGMTTARETYEAEFRWGPHGQGVFTNGLIDGNSIDVGNTPTFQLRPGLLLGQVISTGKYKAYSPTATDGTEVAAAILIEGLRMLDFSSNPVDKFYAVLVGGPVQAAKILGLDNMARSQMDKFIFDDIFNIPGNHWFPWKRFQSKTANYTIVANDNLSHFDNLGAAGAVTFTLPAIANGYLFGFSAMAAQNLLVTSNEGTNVVTFNNAVATTVALQTGGNIIGGGFRIYSNPAATKWIVEPIGANTVTVS